MTYAPKPGQYLHASCSDEDVYEIIGSGEDDNGAPTLDVRVIDLNEILHFRVARDDSGLRGRGPGQRERAGRRLLRVLLPVQRACLSRRT